MLPNGTWLSTGITRLEIWPADRRKEATQRDVLIGDHPVEPGKIVVQPSKIFASRSSDQGRTWQTEEYVIP